MAMKPKAKHSSEHQHTIDHVFTTMNVNFMPNIQVTNTEGTPTPLPPPPNVKKKKKEEIRMKFMKIQEIMKN